jgi:hypothetical protein
MAFSSCLWILDQVGRLQTIKAILRDSLVPWITPFLVVIGFVLIAWSEFGKETQPRLYGPTGGLLGASPINRLFLKALGSILAGILFAVAFVMVPKALATRLDRHRRDQGPAATQPQPEPRQESDRKQGSPSPARPSASLAPPKRSATISFNPKMFSSDNTLTFVHNLRTSTPQLVCYDSEGNLFEVGGIRTRDPNTLIISMAVPMTGTCTARK